MRTSRLEKFGNITRVVVDENEIMQPQAEMAERLMRHLAIVAAVPDGMDDALRQKFRLMTPEEIVERATTIADLAWKEFRKRDWLLDVPAPVVNDESKPE